jgi:hypothetical protein
MVLCIRQQEQKEKQYIHIHQERPLVNIHINFSEELFSLYSKQYQQSPVQFQLTSLQTSENDIKPNYTCMNAFFATLLMPNKFNPQDTMKYLTDIDVTHLKVLLNNLTAVLSKDQQFDVN